MEATTVIQIGVLQGIIGIVVFVATVGIAWGTLKNSVKNIIGNLDEMKPDLKNVRERFMVIEDRVDTLWKDKLAPASSPRQLNDKGNGMLNNSGMKNIVDEKKSKLLELVKAKNAKNAYDAEIAIEEVMRELPVHFPGIIEKLKEGAFKVGADIGGLLFVGSIYLRNQIFYDLGFSLDDLDKPKKQ